jgi:glycosyltransferase involved in cell wall biosynthesis
VTVLIIGPTPPPYQGQSVFTAMLLAPGALDRAFRVVHLETADRRPLDNMGRLDVHNVRLGLAHTVRLARLIRRHRPQVVYIGVAQNRLGYLRDAVFMTVARLFGCRIVTQLHGSALGDFYQGAGPVMRWVIRTTSGWLSAAAVLSPRLLHVYDELVPPERLRAVAAGVPDPLATAPMAASAASGPSVGRAAGGEGGGGDAGRLAGGARGGAAGGGAGGRAGGDGVVVGYLGTLYEPKGYLELIRAAALLSRDQPEGYTFRLAGDWFSEAERRQAMELVAGSGLDGVVEVVGPVAGAAKGEFLASLDFLVFPGHQPEGLPLVVLEAMAAGRPVVATPMGAIPDVIVPGETGDLVPPRDPAALAAAIRRLAADPAARARYGAAGRERYLAEYTEEKCVERTVELLRHGLERAG